MHSPVVHSRFGSRPLLEVPAMTVPRTEDMNVTSLVLPPTQYIPAPAAPTVPAVAAPAVAPQTIPAVLAIPTVPAAQPDNSSMNQMMNQTHPLAPLTMFPNAANPMMGPGLFNLQPFPIASAPQQLASLSPAPMAPPHSAPAGPLYNSQGRQYYYGPNGEIIFPPPVYPGVANPFSGGIPNQGTHPHGYNPYGGPPGRPMFPGPEPRPFSVDCELEFGRVIHIDLTDSPSTFRGIPEFIRLELLRTYGSEPHTSVKIRYANGEFHIYAGTEKHRPRKEQQQQQRRQRVVQDSDSDGEESYYGEEYGQSDVDSFAPINPRNAMMKPRKIVHEKGWNRFR